MSGLHRNATGFRFEQRDLVDGRYRLDRQIGLGAYGEVWRATRLEIDVEIPPPVAVKLLYDEQLADQSWLEEARTMTRVSENQWVVTIRDFGVCKEPRVAAYLVMDLLEGETLAQRLVRGKVWWRRALSIAAKIAAALNASHGAGIVHCDLKPQNTFLTSDGDVRILDFGVARFSEALRAPSSRGTGGSGAFELEGETEETSVEEMLNIMQPGFGLFRHGGPNRKIAGTPGYIAPEVWVGHEPSPAADVYGLGVLLYRMIAGRLPYDVPLEPVDDAHATPRASNKEALYLATVRGEVLPITDVPRGVAELIEVMMEVDPDRRPSTNDACHSDSKLSEAIDRALRWPDGVPDRPFPGQRPYELGESALMAGRDREVEAIIRRLEDSTTIALVGPSGCGKSSLAISGVAAGLDERMFRGLDGWLSVAVRPLGGVEAVWKALHVLSRDDYKLGLVIVVDQADDLLTSMDEPRRIEFLDGIRAALESDKPVRVITTAREEIFGRLGALTNVSVLLEQVYFVRPVEPNAASEMILRPTDALGYKVAGGPTVTRAIQKEIRGNPWSLPLVQIALARWWDERDPAARTLRDLGWEAMGGVGGAVVKTAEEFYSACPASDQSIVQQLLLELTSPDGAIRRVTEERLVDLVHSTDPHPEQDRVRAVLGALVKTQLLREERHARGPTNLVMAHSALLKHWPRLSDWQQEVREFRTLEQEIERDATAYFDLPSESPRRQELLWRGSRLRQARAFETHLHPDEKIRRFTARSLAASRKATLRSVVGLMVLGILVTIGVLAYQGQLESSEAAAWLQFRTETKCRQTIRSQADKLSTLRERLGVCKADGKTWTDKLRSMILAANKEVERLRDQLAKAPKRKQVVLVTQSANGRSVVVTQPVWVGRNREEIINEIIQRCRLEIPGCWERTQKEVVLRGLPPQNDKGSWMRKDVPVERPIGRVSDTIDAELEIDPRGRVRQVVLRGMTYDWRAQPPDKPYMIEICLRRTLGTKVFPKDVKAYQVKAEFNLR